MSLKLHKQLFRSYVQQYLEKSDDEHYLLKIMHTGDVVKIITKLGKLLKLSEQELFIAQLSALYHDLGRFPQYEQYKTFKDHLSVNHAQLSIDILDKLGYCHDLTLEDQKRIKIAIIEHNKKEVSDSVSNLELPLVKLLRDADKLSNFAIVIKNYANFKVPQCGIYDKNLLENLLVGNSLDIKDIKTIEDYYLYHLAWLNDLNFKESVNYAHQANYIKNIIDRIEDNNTKETLNNYFNNFN